MSSTGEKCGALVGEKSQTVHSANWKLDAMLKREKQMLDVSKKRVEHRITMDKQVVRKRFYMKLHRSKLHHARMTGNKEMLQKLLVQGNFDNNYGAGNDESSNMINCGEKPVRNIKSASARLIRAKEREMRSTVGSRLGNTRLTPKEGDTSVQEKVKRPYTSSDVERKSSVPTKVSNEGTAQPSTPLSSGGSDGGDVLKRNVPKVRPVTAGVVKQTDDQVITNKSVLGSKDDSKPAGSRPKTAIGTMPLTKDAPEECRSTVLSRNAATSESVSKAEYQTEGQDKSKQGNSSIFNERPKMTLLDLQMSRIRRANFSSRIKTFTESIPPHLKVDSTDVIDLYSADLVDKISIDGNRADRQNKLAREIESEVEREEELRSTGNIHAPNMTFKELNLNYKNTKSECVEAVPFFRKSSGLAGMLRHRSISKLSIPSTAWESDEGDFSD